MSLSTMKYEETNLGLPKDWEPEKELNEAGRGGCGALSPGALGALLEGGAEEDPERRVAALGLQLARLDAANVAGMLAAATSGAGARLAAALGAGLQRAGELADRRARLQPPAGPAPHRAAAPDDNARRLLRELGEITGWLDAPPLHHLDDLAEVSLASAAGRARALAACAALRTALRAENAMPAARRRLGAVRERLRCLARARDQLAANVARHVNNLLIHLGNEASAAPPAPPAPLRHHADLLPLAPLMRCLKEMDEKSFEALAKVYTSTWARVHERSVRAACEAARAAPGGKEDVQLDSVLTLVETLCSAEQEFCTQFFHLDRELEAEGSGGGAGRAGPEGRRYMRALFPALEAALLALTHHVEKQDQYGAFRVLACVGRRVLGAEGEAEGEGAWARAALAGVAVAAKRQADRCVAERAASLEEGARSAARRHKCGVLPFLRDFDQLTEHCERIFAGGRRADLERWYGSLASSMLAAVARASHPRTPRPVLQLENYHALGGALAALRVPALEPVRRECRARYADALKAYVTQYFGRPLEKLTLFFEGVAEAVAGGVRESEVCYRAAFSKHELRRLLALYPAHEGTLPTAFSKHELRRLLALYPAHEGTLPTAFSKHELRRLLALYPAHEGTLPTAFSKHELRRLLALYPAHEGTSPTAFSEHELRRLLALYPAHEGTSPTAFSEHELRRLLALYPAHEVRKSLHRLYRTVEKHLSEESGLLQVVWRAMQEEFIAQHRALQARIAACYPAAGLALPLTTRDILDAFSDIAREH